MPEVFSDGFSTTLVGAISSTSRPVTFTVAATDATLAGGTFSIIIFDAGTDASPTHAEILEVNDGSTTTWVASTEPTHTATTHASGSTVKQILTRRSLAQPLVDHSTLATTPDPHTGYLRKTTFTTKGDAIIGTGSGTFTREAVGTNGQVLVADSTAVTGRRWGTIGFTGLLAHMGDLVVSGLLGAAARLGIGTAGQVLTVVQNTAAVGNPVSGPSCSAGPSGGTFVNGTSYDFAFAWTNGSSPDAGITLPSPRTTFVATSTGSVNVQAPAAPTAGLTLLVYEGTLAGTLHQSATTLPNASTSTPNVILVNGPIVGTQPVPNTVNTTGGLTAAWGTSSSGLTSVGFAAPAEFAVTGSPRTSNGTITLSKTESPTSPSISNGGTITTAGVGEVRISNSIPATGLILQAGTYGGQEVWVVNQSVVLNSLTMAASGTSNVANGTDSVIAGLTAHKYVWNSGASLWYEGPSLGFANPMTTLGDVIIAAASGVASRLGIGTTGQILSVVSGSPAWSRAVDVATAVGDIIIGGVAGLPTRLGIGSAGQILSVVAGSPAWTRAVDVMTGVGDLITGGAGGAPTRLSPGTAGQILQANGPGSALTWVAPSGGGGGSSGSGGGGGALIPIQVIGPLTAAQATLTFSSIPQTGFRNLRLSVVARGATAATQTAIALQFNGDTGANYNWSQGFFTSSAGADQHLGDTSLGIGLVPAGSGTAARSGSVDVQLSGYNGTTFHKTSRAFNHLSFDDSTTDTQERLVGGTWKSTAPISAITAILAAGNFDVGSYACLYGEMDTQGQLLTPASNLLFDSGTLIAPAATIDSTNLSQSYQNLRIEVNARGTTAATTIRLQATVNGDSSASYNWTGAQISNGSAGSFGSPASAASDSSWMLGLVPAASAPAGDSSGASIVIPNYTNTALRKEARSSNGYTTADTLGNYAAISIWGYYRSLNPITRLTFTLSAGSFDVGSSIRIYGEPVSAGGVSSGSGTRLRISSNQSITTATATAVAWDTEDSDADNQHFSSAANLTGTVSKTSGSAVLAGSSTLFTSELSVGQVISVPGTAAEVAVVIAIASDTSLTVAKPFANSASAQTAARVNSAVVFRQPGFYTVSLGIYWASAASGNQNVSIRLNGTTSIGENDKAAISAAMGQTVTIQRQFQQWDYIEATVTQASGGSINITADERTSFSVSSRPTVLVGSNTQSALYQQTKIRGTGNKTTTSTTFVVIDSTNLPPLPLILSVGDIARCILAGQSYGTGGGVPSYDFQVVQPTIGTTRVNNSATQGATEHGGSVSNALNVVSTFVATESGLHTFQPVFKIFSSGTGVLANGTTSDDSEILFSVEKVGVNGVSSGGNVPSFAGPNQFLAGPSSGVGTPALRTIVPADVPVMVASGGSHAAGLVPDPGTSLGNTRFLREDATFAVPTGSGGGSGGGGGSGALVPIQAIGPLTVAQATLAFSNIPQTGFRNLRIVLKARGTTASTNVNINAQFNGDTGANYDWNSFEWLGTNTSSAQGAAAGTSAQIGTMSASSATAGFAGQQNILIADYVDTALHKSFAAEGSYRTGSTAGATQGQSTRGFWRSTAAISSIVLTPAAGSFDVGTYVCLYGEMDTAGVLLAPASNLLSETVLTAAQATISIPSIAQNYRDLVVEIDGRGDTAAASIVVSLQVNGDSGSNYDSNILLGSAGGAASGAQQVLAGTAAQIFQLFPAASAPSNVSGGGRIVLPNYTATTFQKTMIAHGVGKSGTASGNIGPQVSAGFWRSTSAITSLLLLPSAGNFSAGTTVRVFGEPVSAGGSSVGTGTRLRLNGNQSITTATATALAWDTEDNDADNQHYPSVASLTGTVTKTAASQTLTGSSTVFLTELSVGQVISVPGTATEKRVVIAIASNTSLTVNTAFVNSASAQTAARVNTAVVFRQPGFYTLEANIYSAALASGAVTLAYYLNSLTTATSGTPIGEKDPVAINASAGYDLVIQRQFQQWDFVEVVWTQNSGGSVNVLADERTHWSIGARPTVIVAVPYINIQDQKAQNTNAQGLTSGAWRTRNLTTVTSDIAGVATLASNQITLPPGQYRANIHVPGYYVHLYQSRLQNITTSTTILSGTSELSDAAGTGRVTASVISGKFTLNATTVLEVQQQVATTNSTSGGGIAANFGTEVYTVVELWKEG